MTRRRTVYACTLAAALAWSAYYAYSRLANNTSRMKRALRPRITVDGRPRLWRAAHPRLDFMEARISG